MKKDTKIIIAYFIICVLVLSLIVVLLYAFNQQGNEDVIGPSITIFLMASAVFGWLLSYVVIPKHEKEQE